MQINIWSVKYNPKPTWLAPLNISLELLMTSILRLEHSEFFLGVCSESSSLRFNERWDNERKEAYIF